MAGPTEPGPRGRPSAGKRAATSLGRPASHRLPGASRGDGPSTTAGAAVGLTGKAARASRMDARPGLGLDVGSYVAWIGAFVETVMGSGGSALLSGDAGIGKSTLLDAAAEEARRRGVRVLRAEGAEFESDLSDAVLNQLLRPVLAELDGLDPPLQDALRVGLGLGASAVPSPLAMANAALAELSTRAALITVGAQGV